MLSVLLLVLLLLILLLLLLVVDFVCVLESLGMVVSLSWILLVCAAGVVDSEMELRRGGVMPLGVIEYVFLRRPCGCEWCEGVGKRTLPNMVDQPVKNGCRGAWLSRAERHHSTAQ